MFVLDTNVLSAVMGSRPAPEAAAWVAAQPEERLFTTAVCQAEILAGVEILPEGRRRRAGRPTATFDLIIASVARATGATMVTRNTADFEGCGLTLVNPWEAP